MLIAGSSLYIHFPFCRRRCHYCHFYVVKESRPQQELYWEALQREWALRLPLIASRPLVTCYFGGGTPSLLEPERVAQLIRQLPSRPGEITLEANPEECVAERLAAYRAAGVNRLSIGIQTFDDPLLRRLNRLHTARQAQSAVWQAAAAGFSNITIDLMYDLPDQTLASWQQTLAMAVELPITHLSLYNLVLEPGSLFARRSEQVAKTMPNEALSLAMWEAAHATLSAAGFTHYALSAFERGGHPSQHNLGYWTGRPFIGLGPSAWSYWEGRRFQNHADLQAYATATDQTATSELLTPEAARREQLVLALRLARGIQLRPFEGQWGPLELASRAGLQQLVEAGLLESPAPDQFQATPRGFQLFDSIAATLV
jgi:oxygen-independent coproporphyrinogen III oxidase